MEHQQQNTNRVDIICLARQNSSRFPNKIFAHINGRPMVDYIIDKLKQIHTNIIFAIPNSVQNNELADYLQKHSVTVFRGSENNVLERFSSAAVYSNAQYLQRFNCDNLLFDVKYMTEMHKLVQDCSKYDVYTNTHCRNHSGQSIEIVKRDLCHQISNASLYEEEHVFPYFYRACESKFHLPCPETSTFPIDEPFQLEKVIKSNLLNG